MAPKMHESTQNATQNFPSYQNKQHLTSPTYSTSTEFDDNQNTTLSSASDFSVKTILEKRKFDVV